MKTETALKTFVELMKNLGYKNIEIREAKESDYDQKGVYQVGYVHNGHFLWDIDIFPPDEMRVKFLVQGYRTTPYSYHNPPETEEFTIAECSSFSQALQAVIEC